MKTASENKYEITDELFALFAGHIYKVAGIRLGSQKKGLLVSRLQKRLNALDLDNFHDYFKTVRGDNEECITMLNFISTNTTKFFREMHHFDFLRKVVMPELYLKHGQDKKIRIWSAGCSTGEEPYSVAVSLCEAFNELSGNCSYSGWDIKILATDISTKVLDKAKTGIYELEQMPDDVQTGILSRYFLKGSNENAGRIKAKDFIKDMIRFERLNLKETAYPFRSPFDIIFCRNVMIYFDEAMKDHVLTRFHQHLSTGGYLFMGHSETMLEKDRFTPVHITSYRKR